MIFGVHIPETNYRNAIGQKTLRLGKTNVNHQQIVLALTDNVIE
jgi:hypothetical protein